MAEIKRAKEFGLEDFDAKANFRQVMARMRKIRAGISHHDGVPHLSKELGVDVFFGVARFVDHHTIEVNSSTGEKQLLKFSKACIATGARPRGMKVPGIEDVGFFTSDTIFDLVELPEQLAVFGAGPIGVELAQTFARLGAQVYLFFSKDKILDKEDDDAALLVKKQLLKDGVILVANSSIQKVRKDQSGNDVIVEYKVKEKGDEIQNVKVKTLLLALGRTPNTESLNLDAAGVKIHPQTKHVVVNDYFQTTNPNIFACGDVCLPHHQFTHAAEKTARAVVNNAFVGSLLGKIKLSSLIIPRSTYSSPEIAVVGITIREAQEKKIEFEILTKKFNEIDRALTDGTENGFATILLKKGTDKILGAMIVSEAGAGDMLSELCLAMSENIGLSKLANVVHPYPTQADIIRLIADGYTFRKVEDPNTQWYLKRLMKWKL